MSYESVPMSSAEIDEFLAETRHAVMGTNRIDGSPQLSPVWYLYRDGKFHTSVYGKSAKYCNLGRDHRVTLCVDGVYPDARYVAIYGTVEFVEEESPWRDEIEKALAHCYHESSEEAERYLRETKVPGAIMLVVTPHKVFGRNYN